MRFALLLLSWLVLPCFAADTYRHAPSGFECLPEIAGFNLTEVHDYEVEYPGQGVSCTYVAQSAPYGAQIYIFNEKLTNVPADITHPIVVQLRERTLKDIERSAQAHNETARNAEHAVLTVEMPRGRVSAYYDAIIITAASGTRTTWAWLWTARNHFIKIRMTRAAPGSLSPRRAREFFEAVARLAAE